MQRSTGESLTAITSGGDTYLAKMQNGMSYSINQKDWSLRHDYYLDMFVEHLPLIVDELRQGGNPLRNILEIGIARGVLSIGLALLTDQNTQIVGIDINEGARALVAENAGANGVADRIEVRIGDFFAPVQSGESFDLIIAELPLIPVLPEQHEEYSQAGYGDELLNISGGPDGRFFIDALISQGSRYLNPGGAIVLIHASFINVGRTMDLFAECGLVGSVVARREWLLRDTKFTRANRPYIESVHGDVFGKRADGEDIFYLTIMKGVRSIA